MEILIIAVIVGLGIAYFATQNPLTIPIYVGFYHFTNIPLYMLVTGALLAGLVIAWIISFFNYLGNAFLFRRQSNKIQEDNKIIENLNNKIHDLELENTRLKERNANIASNSQGDTKYHNPSLLGRLRQSV